MASTPSVERSLRRTFERMVASWNDFFFKPRDPSTLGLMRIMAGVFILYTTLAHTWDLYSFFGKHAWLDLETVNAQRKEYPFPAPAWSWNDTSQNINVPQDRQVRQAFLLNWAMKLPADIQQRRNALRFLIELPLNPADANEGLAFAQRLLIRAPGDDLRAPLREFRRATEQERRQMLDALTREEILPQERHLIPSVMQELPLERRKQIASTVETFNATMPANPGDVVMIFAHLSNQAVTPLPVLRPGDPRTELQRTVFFLTEQLDPNASSSDERGPYMPNDLQERREVLEYLNRWSVDPRRTFVRGFHIFSVWFHVTDPFWMAVIHCSFLVVIAMFAAGLWTRVTSVITWVAVLSYINRNGNITFGMDTMENIALIYLMIGPSGAALSVDRWLEVRRARRELERARAERRDPKEWEAILAGPRSSSLANFVTRMVQIHFCFIYAASGLSKLKGPAWWNHTAIWLTMANPEFSPVIFQPYLWALTQTAATRWLCELFMSAGSVYTLFLEIAFPFLVWRPLLRPYMVICGVLLHTGIAVFMGLTVFGLFMLVLLMSYIPPETVRRWIELGEKRPSAPPPTPAPAAPVHAAAKA